MDAYDDAHTAGLGDLPGITGMEQRLEVALAARALGGLELLRHQLVVDRALHVPEDPDRRRADRRPRQPRQRERQGGLRMLGVVHQETARRGVNDLDRAVRALAHATRRLLR